jgi:hypothetical protein
VVAAALAVAAVLEVMEAQHLLALILLLVAAVVAQERQEGQTVAVGAVQAGLVAHLAPEVAVVVWAVMLFMYTTATALLEKGRLVLLEMALHILII